MRISGLLSQWKTRDGLFAFIADKPTTYPIYNEELRVIRELFWYLETLEGPDLWIGSSHRLFNFNLRDCENPLDRIPSLVTVEAYKISEQPPRCGYQVGFSLTGADWEYHFIDNVEEAGHMIRRLMLWLAMTGPS